MKRLVFIGIMCALLVTMAVVVNTSANQTRLDLGVTYLANVQNTDGSWGKQLDLQATAFAIAALHAADVNCSRDITAMERRVPITAYDLALQLIGCTKQEAVQQLLALQDNEGAWEGPYITALALIGLQRAGVNNPEAVTYLLEHQNSDGSWGQQGTAELTAVILYSLSVAGQGTQEGVARGFSWLIQHQSPQGGWDHPVIASWAVLALQAGGQNKGTAGAEAISQAIEYLLSERCGDYGWSEGKEQNSSVYSTALAVWALSSIDPEDQAITEGIAYLESQRGGQAGWCSQEMSISVTMQVADALKELGRTEPLSAAGRWMELIVPRTTAGKAARLSFLNNHDTLLPEIKSSEMAGILAMENLQGGWGTWLGYEGDVLTTASVLRSLWEVGCADAQLYNRIMAFLRKRQASDGSFSMLSDEAGQVYLTAYLVLALKSIDQMIPTTSITEPAINWLMDQKNADGTWSRGVLDTSMAFLAVADRLSGTDVDKIEEYLENNQSPDGAWERDDLTTAVALLALNQIKANITVSSESITIAPETVYLNDETIIGINVKNDGLSSGENVRLQLYHGTVETGTLIGEEYITLLAAKSSQTVTYSWQADNLGLNTFTVVLDPDDHIAETCETDNSSVKIVLVEPKIDLSITSDEIIITPEDPAPSDELTIKTTVRHHGRLPSAPCKVAFYNGNPETGGTLLTDADCPGLSDGQTAELAIKAQLPVGEYDIFVVVDQENAVKEDNEDNNTASMELSVQKRYDLAINSRDIVFSDENPDEGDIVRIYATVVNKREENVDQVPVAFYLGNPAKDGVLLGQTVIEHIEANQSGLAEFDWDTAGYSGRHILYVVVDPQNIINEVDETNNEALRIIYLTLRPDFVVVGATGNINASEGLPVYIAFAVKNQGGTAAGCRIALFLGEPISENRICGDFELAPVNPGAQVNAQLSLDTVGLSGLHTITIQLDPDNLVNEMDELNNLATRTINITPAPDVSITGEDLRFIPEIVEDGDQAVIAVTVHNLTQKAFNGLVVRLQELINDKWLNLADKTVNLPGNQQVTLQFDWNRDSLAGEYSFRVILDPDDKVYERNKINNTATQVLEVFPARMPDLTVVKGSIITDPPFPARDSQAVLKADIVNLRSMPANGGVIRFYQGDPRNGGIQIGNDLTLSIGARERITVEVPWDTTGLRGYQEITVWVDASEAIDEYDEQNNIASTWIRLAAPAAYQPQNLHGEAVYHDATLTWDPVELEDVIGYLVYRDGKLLNSEMPPARGSTTASSSYSTQYLPSRAVDGNASTYWYSARTTGTHWFEEEFANYQYVEKMEIEWGPYIGQDYQVQIWDGGKYVPLISEIGNATKKVTYNIEDYIQKYRIVVTRSTSNNAATIAEIGLKTREIVGLTSFSDLNLSSGKYSYYVSSVNQQGEISIPSLPAIVAVLPPAAPQNFVATVQGPDVNLSWDPSTASDCVGYYLRRDGQLIGHLELCGGTASAAYSANNNYLPEKALDGNDNTIWYYSGVPGSPVWWQMDLSKERYLDSLEIKWHSIAIDYQILAWSGGQWNLLADVKGNTQAIARHDIASDLKTDKLRISIIKTTGTNYGIREVVLDVESLITDLSYSDCALRAGSYAYAITAENILNCESEAVVLQAVVDPPETPNGLRAAVNGPDVSLTWEHNQEPGLLGYLVLRNGMIVNKEQLNEVAAEGHPSASSQYNVNNNADKAIDRDPNTFWRSDGKGPTTFTLKFDAPKVISSVRMQYVYVAYDYQILYREGDKWISILDVQANRQAEVNHEFSYPVWTDEIRIQFLSGATQYFGIRELYLEESFLGLEKALLDAELSEGDYSYSVIACDKAFNWSVPSIPAQAKVGFFSSPYDLTAAAVNDKVTLSWSMADNADVGGYILYRNQNRINEQEDISRGAVCTTSVNQHLAGRLNDGNTGTYWQGGSYPIWIEAAFSQEVDINQIMIQWSYNPAKDFDILIWQDEAWVKVREIRGNTLALNEISLADGFIRTSKIRLELISGTVPCRISEIGVRQTSLISTPNYEDIVARSGWYTYHVKAVSITGVLSGDSNSAVVKVEDRMPPSAPAGFGIIEQTGRLYLQWTANSEPDLAGYHIYWGKSDRPLNTAILPKQTVAYAHNLTDGIDAYEFSIVAEDLNGNRSNPSTASFQFASPSAPLNLKAVVNKRDVTLSWNAAPGMNILGYKVYRNGMLLNSSQKIGPTQITASSVYFNNANYAVAKINDINDSTFWRPHISDTEAWAELRFGIRLISAIEVVWHSELEIPQSYQIQAFIDEQWQTIFEGEQTVRSIYRLPAVLKSDRIRIIFLNDGTPVSLSEFIAYRTVLYNSLTLIDVNLEPGNYVYTASAENRAGLEGPESQPFSVEIAARDLAIAAGDLFYTPYQPSVFDNITISVKVHNAGTETINQAQVGIYLGNPSAGGLLMQMLEIETLQPGEEAFLQFVWDPTGHAGKAEIHAVADPQNLVNEYDETNNSISRVIEIRESAVLQLEASQVESSAFPHIKLHFKASDSLGEGVAGLRKENFAILENDLLQTITKVTYLGSGSDELAQIDLVFVVDTSGSMWDEWATLPGIIQGLADTLAQAGIDLHLKVYALGAKYGNIPDTEVLTKGIFNGNVVNITSECWGPGTAWVAEYYQWRAGAYRIVIPISDENCYQGGGQDQNDLKSIAEAVQYCQRNAVEAYPFHGFSDTSQSVKDEMKILADGTGGEMFFFQDANQVISYLTRVLSSKKSDYIIEYDTSNPSKDGTIRQIDLQASYRHAVGDTEAEYQAPQDLFGDLVAVEIRTDPVIQEHQELKITGMVRNIGGINIENAKLQFYLGDPQGGGILLDTQMIGAIAPNEAKVLPLTWNSHPGTYQIYMVIDAENVIPELDEENNAVYVELHIPGKQKPDLLIKTEEMILERPTPDCGERVRINARVRNAGLGCGAFQVAFYQGDPQQNGELISSVRVPSLEYLGYADVSCIWIAPRKPELRNIYIVVDPTDEISEYDKMNNICQREVTVNARPVAGSINTDKTVYTAYEDVNINLAVENGSLTSWSGLAKVVVRDAQGQIVKEAGMFNIMELAGMAEGVPGRWNQTAYWHTGRIDPGQYYACLQLLENGDFFAESAVGFEVSASRALIGELATDKTGYLPAEQATITVRLDNTSANSAFESLDVFIRISDLDEQEIWTDSKTVPHILLNRSIIEQFVWPIEQNAGGTYAVSAQAKSGEEIVWTAQKLVTVNAKAVLSGELTIAPSKVRSDQAVGFSYSIRNLGNLPLANVPVQILVINPGNNTQPVLIFERYYPLGIGDTVTDVIVETVPVPDGQYMIVLQALVGDSTIPLSAGSLLVDSTPPVSSYTLTHQKFEQDNVIYGVIGSTLVITAHDNLSGVGEIVWDQGAGPTQYTGPVTFITEGRYSIQFHAVDRVGNVETPKTVTIVIDQTPPVTRIVAPVDGQEVESEFAVIVEAFDAQGLDRAELFVNGQKYAEFAQSPFEVLLTCEPGEHILQSWALDLAGYEAWSAPVKITVRHGDQIPPVTSAALAGDKWSDAVFKSDVTVTLTAVDNDGGSGVAAIYYRIGEEGPYQVYTGPFAVSSEGAYLLHFFATDNTGNRETPKTLAFVISKPWSGGGLLCQEFNTSGNVGVDYVFSNGPVVVKGNGDFGYLGTAQDRITRNGSVDIEELELSAPYRPLPEPDWAALEQATELHDEKSVAGDVTLTNARFEQSVKLSGKVRVKGLLVVKGDLHISANTEFDGIGIFCTGTITISGRPTIKGFIYAGGGLKITGTPDIQGALIVNGLARMAGNMCSEQTISQQYFLWLRKSEDEVNL